MWRSSYNDSLAAARDDRRRLCRRARRWTILCTVGWSMWDTARHGSSPLNGVVKQATEDSLLIGKNCINITRPDLLDREAIVDLATVTAAKFTGQYLTDRNLREP